MSMLEGKMGMIAGVAAAAAGVAGVAWLLVDDEEEEVGEKGRSVSTSRGGGATNDGTTAGMTAAEREMAGIVSPVVKAMKKILTAGEFAQFDSLPKPKSKDAIQAWEAQLQPFIQDPARQQAFLKAYEMEQQLHTLFESQVVLREEMTAEYKKVLSDETFKTYEQKFRDVKDQGAASDLACFDALDDWVVDNVEDFSCWEKLQDEHASKMFETKKEEFETKFTGAGKDQMVAQLIQQQTLQCLKQASPQAAQKYSQLMQLIMSGQVPESQAGEVQVMLQQTVQEALPPQMYLQLQQMTQTMPQQVEAARIDNEKKVYKTLMDKFSLRAVINKEDTQRLRAAERQVKLAKSEEGKENATKQYDKIMSELIATYHEKVLDKMTKYEAQTGQKAVVADPGLDLLEALTAKKTEFEKKVSDMMKFSKTISHQRETMLEALDAAKQLKLSPKAQAMYDELLEQLKDGGSLEGDLRSFGASWEATLNGELETAAAEEVTDESEQAADESETAADDDEPEAGADDEPAAKEESDDDIAEQSAVVVDQITEQSNEEDSEDEDSEDDR